MGYLKKFILAFISSIFFFPLLILPAQAEGEFLVDSLVEYKVETNGQTQVTYTITLENVFSNLYAKTYSLILENIEPQNIKAFDNSGELTVKSEKEDNKINIRINFNDPLVGKGKQRTFYLSYQTGDLARKTGEVWEISIPRLLDEKSFRNYTIKLLVPGSFKNEAYFSPAPVARSYRDDYKIYTFNKEAITQTGITAGFGDFQVFSFNLIYHLENPLVKNATTEIAIPPDTSLQKVYYEKISPRPENVRIDEDGNWLASYTLKSRERLDIEVKGSVQIFATPREFPQTSDETLKKNLNESEFWQTSNPQIIDLARRLATPQAIYHYVSTYLKYDYDRVKPNVVRLGAVAALANPQSAICMEFTDLFIALARAAGIPAREINGFAYTENPEIQPLSLVNDVLHSWPEYWDQKQKTWIPIDPTWATTTGGVDFFNKLDLRHFTFVIHGTNPVKPYPPGSYKLGSNPQKDVYVSFGSLPEVRAPKIILDYNLGKFKPFFNQKLNLEIANDGNEANETTQVQIYFDRQLVKEEYLGLLPPYASKNISLEIPFSFFGRQTPKQIKVKTLNKEIIIPTFKNQVILYNLLLIFLVLVLTILLILIKLDKINLGKVKKLFSVYLEKQ